MEGKGSVGCGWGRLEASALAKGDRSARTTPLHPPFPLLSKFILCLHTSSRVESPKSHGGQGSLPIFQEAAFWHYDFEGIH